MLRRCCTRFYSSLPVYKNIELHVKPQGESVTFQDSLNYILEKHPNTKKFKPQSKPIVKEKVVVENELSYSHVLKKVDPMAREWKGLETLTTIEKLMNAKNRETSTQHIKTNVKNIETSTQHIKTNAKNAETSTQHIKTNATSTSFPIQSSFDIPKEHERIQFVDSSNWQRQDVSLFAPNESHQPSWWYKDLTQTLLNQITKTLPPPCSDIQFISEQWNLRIKQALNDKKPIELKDDEKALLSQHLVWILLNLTSAEHVAWMYSFLKQEQISFIHEAYLALVYRTVFPIQQDTTNKHYLHMNLNQATELFCFNLLKESKQAGYPPDHRMISLLCLSVSNNLHLLLSIYKWVQKGIHKGRKQFAMSETTARCILLGILQATFHKQATTLSPFPQECVNELWFDLPKMKLELNQNLVVAFLSLAKKFKQPQEALKLTMHVVKVAKQQQLVGKLPWNRHVYDALIENHCRLGSIKAAQRALDELTLQFGAKPDRHHFNCLLPALQDPPQVINYFTDMSSLHLVPSNDAIRAVVQAAVSLEQVKVIDTLYHMVLKHMTARLQAAEKNHMTSTHAIFDQDDPMPCTLSNLAHGYCQLGRLDQALGVFHEWTNLQDQVAECISKEEQLRLEPGTRRLWNQFMSDIFYCMGAKGYVDQATRLFETFVVGKIKEWDYQGETGEQGPFKSVYQSFMKGWQEHVDFIQNPSKSNVIPMKFRQTQKIPGLRKQTRTGAIMMLEKYLSKWRILEQQEMKSK